MTRNLPYVGHREAPLQRLDKAAQIQREQRTNLLRDKARKLGLPESGLEGFVYSLGPCLLGVEKPASPEVVEAHLRLQSAAHELHRAIDIKMKRQTTIEVLSMAEGAREKERSSIC